MLEFFLDYLQSHGISQGQSQLLLTVVLALLSSLLLVASELLTKKVLLQFVSVFTQKSKTRFDDLLFRHGVFRWVAHLIPPLLLYNVAVPVFQFYPDTVQFVQSIATIYLTIIVLIAMLFSLDAVQDYFTTHPISRRLPLKSSIQVLKTIIVTIGSIIVISRLLGKSPVVFFSGIGAFTAVIILIFKDSILGFVAGIQLSTNNLVRVGDWIEMPKYGADGDVVDISLVTVSVQNWDKTISTIPAYALISEGFKNWRGMSESGGRRIMRSINIDMQSVQFCDDEMLKKIQGVQLLKEYLDTRLPEIDEYNARYAVDTSVPVNGRRLTNLGLFRAYLVAYLRQHPKINPDMTFLVRHLQPTENGLPVQIYVFSNDVVWANYEALQADIMDHLLCVLSFFDLRVFQNPSGSNIVDAGKAILDSIHLKDEKV